MDADWYTKNMKPEPISPNPTPNPPAPKLDEPDNNNDNGLTNQVVHESYDPNGEHGLVKPS